ncbi:MAG: RNA methyltransferase [Ignavibacteria bacterium]|nr:RNA methyltransferase [Ignavibacteria bacterium]MCC7158174.1 RNA methyltransferase [Ignavibacteria bacterium]
MLESNIKGDLVIALDRISDPGNLGTIIRTAYWFNVSTIILSKDSADPFNQKVLRSSQGGVFNTNIIEDADLLMELQNLKSKGYKIYLFTLDASNSLSKLAESEEFCKSGESEKSVLVFGNESSGISEEILGSDDEFISIKIDGYTDSESLNIGISCGIALYEFRKHTSN